MDERASHSGSASEAIAWMRAPTHAEIIGWRRMPAPFSLADLVSTLLAAGWRCVDERAAEARLRFALLHGRELFVTLCEGGARFECAAAMERPDDELYAALGPALDALQTLTSWHVFASRPEHEPSLRSYALDRACSSCALGCFARERTCPSCGSALRSPMRDRAATAAARDRARQPEGRAPSSFAPAAPR